MKLSKVGRNSPCPCGSGKKYKKCCMNNTTDNINDIRDHLIPRKINIEYGKPLLDKKFFESNSIRELSAQRLVYSNLVSPDLEKFAYQISSKFIIRSKEQKILIGNASCAEDLMNLMNGKLDIINHVPFKEKALNYKDTFIPLLINELKIPKDDAFIELAIQIIRSSDIDLSKEIVQLIKNSLSNAYHISQFCVLLGFFPSVESEQLLWDYFHFFKENYPNEAYKDGPLLGLIEIKEQKKEKFLYRFQAKT